MSFSNFKGFFFFFRIVLIDGFLVVKQVEVPQVFHVLLEQQVYRLFVVVCQVVVQCGDDVMWVSKVMPLQVQLQRKPASNHQHLSRHESETMTFLLCPPKVPKSNFFTVPMHGRRRYDDRAASSG